MERAHWMAGSLLFVGLLACGSDDKGDPCPKDTAIGGTVACVCGDSGGTGTQTCQDDHTLSDCDCMASGGAPTGTGGSGPGTGGTGTGGSTALGSGGATPGTGRTTPEPDVDGGMPADAGTPGTGGSVASAASCSASLAERLRYTDVATDVAPSRSDADMGAPSLAILAPRPRGGSVVGYWGAGAEGKLHIVPLDELDARIGDELVLDRPTNWFASVIAHEHGVAALAFQRRDWWPSPSKPNDIFFAAWDLTGKAVFDLHLGPEYSGFYRAGKLRYGTGRYVAYYPINSQPNDDEGGHEGDKLAFYDDAGQKLEGGWGWGCSHGGDQRLFVDGDKLGVLCDSDAYPEKGLIFMNGTLVHPQPDATGGFGHVELGELIGTPEGFLHVFTTAVESHDPAGPSTVLRPGDEKDLALVALGDDGAPTALRWLTETTQRESRPHVARYGDALFVLYGTVQADASITYRGLVLAEDGEVVRGPEPLELWIEPREELVTHESGEVGWAAPRPDGGLRVYRLATCPSP